MADPSFQALLLNLERPIDDALAGLGVLIWTAALMAIGANWPPLWLLCLPLALRSAHLIRRWRAPASLGMGGR